jgi:hypothetical protein
MKKLSLSYFTATGMDIVSLSAAVELLRMDGLEIEVTARTHLQLFDTARIDDFVSRALTDAALYLPWHEELPASMKNSGAGRISCTPSQAPARVSNPWGPRPLRLPRQGNASPAPRNPKSRRNIIGPA